MNPLYFRWSVADAAGHAWTKGHAEGASPGARRRRYLVARGTQRAYRPLEAFPALFRAFAGTAPDEVGVKAFADKFGLLGGDVSEAIHESRAGQEPLLIGEPLAAWTAEILAMRAALRLWDMSRAGDVHGLAHHVVWGTGKPPRTKPKLTPAQQVMAYAGSGRGAVTVVTDELGARVVYHPTAPAIGGASPPWPDGDLAGPALDYVQREINEHLHDRVEPRLLWSPDRARLELRITPTCLAGAVWLQFARAVATGKSYRQCAVCASWYEVGQRAARTTRRYCSNACRLRAHRARHANTEA